jgi:hypothetical protein
VRVEPHTAAALSADDWRRKDAGVDAAQSATTCRTDGRPTPSRTRWKCPVSNDDRGDRSPLCPLSPPAILARMVPNGMSISSWTTTIRAGGTL